MAAPDAETQKRIADWFSSLDPAFQGVLDAIYAEAPEAVSKVISSGTWTADAGDPPLREVLAGGDAFDYQGLMASGADIKPWPLTEGATLQISIPLLYHGPRDHPAFDTIVTWTTPAGESETRTVHTDAIAPGGSAVVDFELSDLQVGVYDMKFDINPGGAALGAPPNESGTHIEYPMPLTVTSPDQGADMQDDMAWGQARGLLATLVSDPVGAAEPLREALNWLATLELEEDEREAVEEAAQRIDRLTAIDEAGSGRPQAITDAIVAVGVAASQAQWHDPESRRPLLNSLIDLRWSIDTAN